MELIVVLVILSIAGTFAYSSWIREKHRNCAKYAAEQFVQDLRFAREQALVRSTPVTITFNINNYTISCQPAGSPSPVVIRTNGLADKYGPPLTMNPEEGVIVLDYRGMLASFSVETTPRNTIVFGTAPGVVRSVTIQETGFSLVN